jgi:hypothetical protein
MAYRIGDSVRIRSREWIDAQEKNASGDMYWQDSVRVFSADLFCYAGKLARIVNENKGKDAFQLDFDCSAWFPSWALVPVSNTAEEFLSSDEAMRALLAGESLVNDAGSKYWWDNGGVHFRDRSGIDRVIFALSGNLRRARDLTYLEVLRWVRSEDSTDWAVRRSNVSGGPTEWKPAHMIDLSLGRSFKYWQRAKILPDGSGVDENTIRGFGTAE